MKVLCFLPARYSSSRFPGKPLVEVEGKPLIVHSYEAVAKIPLLTQAWVATDDTRILRVLEDRNIPVLLTSKHHKNGTERCAEAFLQLQKKGLTCDYVVNVQGDEPSVDERHIRDLSKLLAKRVGLATLCTSISVQEAKNPHLVKIVLGEENRALYFSRAGVPYLSSDADDASAVFHKHIGVYAYRADLLPVLAQLSEVFVEKRESLEQLRWLAHGYSIHAQETLPIQKSIDVPKDLASYSTGTL